MTPQLAVGGYARRSGTHLGGAFQFRESIDIAYEFASRWRVGIRLAHISNADINSANPGVEELLATFAFPIGPVF